MNPKKQLTGRELVAEWWELWWKKPGATPTRVGTGSWWQDNPHIPPWGMTRIGALKEKKLADNRFYVLVHVRRFKRSCRHDV